MNIDKNWHKQQITKFGQVRTDYKTFASFLQEVLKNASAIYAPMSIVQTRAKTISSYAEKIVRKNKYTDPISQITDLCGARIITHTSFQAEEVCNFIRNSFTIDEKNSLDVRTRLKISEFGYLSVHYIISTNKDEILGIKVPEIIRNRKAEIQVRTLLQHTWSDICHDRLYKTALSLPDQVKRESYRLAALLESADNDFNDLASTIDIFVNNYEVFLSEEELDQEINTLRVILENEPEKTNKPQIVLKICRILKIKNSWKEIIDLLKPFVNTSITLKLDILLELGIAYCQNNKTHIESEDFKLGLNYLEELAELSQMDSSDSDHLNNQKRIKARALKALADTTILLEQDPSKIRDIFIEAYYLDIANPYYLIAYLEWEIFTNRNKDIIKVMRPVLKDAIDRCDAHIQLGVELPNAFFTQGKIWLLLNEPYRSLNAYARAIDLCTSGKACLKKNIFEFELSALNRLYPSKIKPTEYKWVKMLLELGIIVSGEDKHSMEDLALNNKGFDSQVVIIAGDADQFDKNRTDQYEEYLFQAFDDYAGSIISGGTKSGIPGIVGNVIHDIRKKGNHNQKLLGYIPGKNQENIIVDSRYDKIFKTVGKEFSPYEPLFNWIDLINSGTSPNNIRVLGFGGGLIAEFEYKLALCLGAKVGLLESSGRAVSEIINDRNWNNHPNLIIFPDDSMTIKAYIPKLNQIELSVEQIENAAQHVHEKYCETKKKQIVDESTANWKELNENFKESNRQQLRYMEVTLKSINYAVREAMNPEKIKLQKFTVEEIEKMAELEHGRFNADRFLSGWKFGKTKDVKKKISPYLIPWKDLSEEIKQYDRDAVIEIPIVLKEAGFEVYKI